MLQPSTCTCNLLLAECNANYQIVLSHVTGIDLSMGRLQKFLASRDINEAYEIGNILGKGAYSVVKTAKAKKTGEEVQHPHPSNNIE